jgi:hypothetical protein
MKFIGRRSVLPVREDSPAGLHKSGRRAAQPKGFALLLK